VGSIARPKILIDPDEKVDGVDGVEFENCLHCQRNKCMRLHLGVKIQIEFRHTIHVRKTVGRTPTLAGGIGASGTDGVEALLVGSGHLDRQHDAFLGVEEPSGLGAGLQLQSNVHTSSHPCRILLMALGNGDKKLQRGEMLGVSRQSCRQLTTNTSGRHGLMSAAAALLGRQLHDEAATCLVKRAIEGLSEQVTRQSKCKDFEFGTFFGMDQILGKGNQLSRCGSGAAELKQN
jgi:hypothetical protein